MGKMVGNAETIASLQGSLTENAARFTQFCESLKENVSSVMAAYPGDTQTENLLNVVEFDTPKITDGIVVDMRFFSSDYLEKKKQQMQQFNNVAAPI